MAQRQAAYAANDLPLTAALSIHNCFQKERRYRKKIIAPSTFSGQSTRFSIQNRWNLLPRPASVVITPDLISLFCFVSFHFGRHTAAAILLILGQKHLCHPSLRPVQLFASPRHRFAHGVQVRPQLFTELGIVYDLNATPRTEHIHRDSRSV
jgi:hypothetical protein